MIDLEVSSFLTKLDKCIPNKSEHSFLSKKDINILRTECKILSCILSKLLYYLNLKIWKFILDQNFISNDIVRLLEGQPTQSLFFSLSLHFWNFRLLWGDRFHSHYRIHFSMSIFSKISFMFSKRHLRHFSKINFIGYVRFWKNL